MCSSLSENVASEFMPTCPKCLLYFTGIFFVRWEISGCTAVILSDVASRISLIQHVASLCCALLFHKVFSFSRTDTVTTWKNFHFILSLRLELQMVNKLSIEVHALLTNMWTSLSIDCNILTLDRAINQETGASSRRYRNITLNCGRG